MEKISWTDRVRYGEVLQSVKENGSILHTIETRKAIWVCQNRRRNCVLKHVIEGNVEGRIEVTGRRGRGSNQVLGNKEVMETERGSTRLLFMENRL